MGRLPAWRSASPAGPACSGEPALPPTPPPRIATEVDQTVDTLVSQHKHDSALDRLLYTMQLGFQESDARDAQLEANFSKQLLIAVGIVLTALAIATAIVVALFIRFVG